MIKLTKWQENLHSNLVDEWVNHIDEHGVEETFEDAMEEGIYRYNDLCYALITALDSFDREDLVEQIEEKIQ